MPVPTAGIEEEACHDVRVLYREVCNIVQYRESSLSGARTSRPYAHSNARGTASPFWNLGSMQRAHELAAGSDEKGGGVWRRIIEAVAQVANNAPPGPVH